MRKLIVRTFCFCSVLMCMCVTGAGAYSAYGSRGDEVVAIQTRLLNLGYYNSGCDGIYGNLTCDAVREYQRVNNLIPDGIAGRKTLASLKIISESDVNLLAMLINGEARGESFQGQVAVGAVVLNRVDHPAFPDTLRDVIYQKGAFTAVKDGQINLKVNQSCIDAAIEALKGYDPTNGAVYYYNPDTATCKWIRTRSAVKQIGNHLFCV